MESPSKGTAVDLFDCWQGNRESIREYMRESSLEYAPPAWPLPFLHYGVATACFLTATFLSPPRLLTRKPSHTLHGFIPAQNSTVGRLLTRKPYDTLHGLITAQGMPIFGLSDFNQ
jgi:hypothetical protein